MIIYLIFILLIIFSYSFLIIFLLRYWTINPVENEHNNAEGNKSISVIIPVRNEEKNIANCIASILNNRDIDRINPEIIIINDHSTDETVNIIHSFKSKYINLLHLSDYLKGDKINAYKKAAINYGLSKAKGEIIIQLDGDVVIGQEYLLKMLDYFMVYNPDFISAPVVINPGETFISKFQSLDMAGMMALTKAGIQSKKWYLANGANMAYKKSLIHFDENGPASGDDVFGIQQISQLSDSRIHFLNDPKVFVHTATKNSLREFYNQRIRWATKNKSLKGLSIKLVMSIPFINAVIVISHLILSIIFGSFFLVLLAIHLLVKFSIDYLYLSEITSHFKIKKSMKSFIIMDVFHILYIGIIGVLSFSVKNYTWKGREVN